jgi:hypothetical protein
VAGMVVWQVYEQNLRISGGEGSLITVFPNGCQVLHKADPEIVTKVEFFSKIKQRDFLVLAKP